MQVEKLSPAQTGKIIRMRAQAIRLGLQQGRFPFGTAVQKPDGRWTYNIIASKVYDYVGKTREECLEILAS